MDINLLIDMFHAIFIGSICFIVYFQSKRIIILKDLLKANKGMIEANIEVVEKMLKWHREAKSERVSFAHAFINHLKNEHDIDITKGKGKN